jgi:hypothetical protein
MDEEQYEKKAEALIKLLGLGALVPLDVARRVRGNESSSSIYIAMANRTLEARKLGSKTVVTVESLLRSVILAPTATITTGLSSPSAHPTDVENATLAETTHHGQVMRARRRGRPIGSKSRPRAEILAEPAGD